IIASPVTYAATTTLAITTDNSITFADTLDATINTGNLSLNAGGTITFGGDIGSNDPLGTFTIGTATFTTLSANVNTIDAEAVSIASPVSYAATLTITATNSIAFGSVLDAPNNSDLTLNTDGTVTFNGNIGSIDPLGTLTISATFTTFDTGVATVHAEAVSI